MPHKTRKKPVLPKQDRSVKSKERILKAAQHIFAQKGLHGARIDEIAIRAKVNKQRIYAYFGSKQQLYRQILLRVYAQAATDDRIISLSEKDIPKLTSTLLNIFFDFHQKHPQFWRLLAWENLNGGKSLLAQDWKTIRTSYIQHLKGLYETAQQQGQFRKNVDFSVYLMMVFSVTYFYYSNQLTISHLLNLKLKSKQFRKQMERELDLALCFGIQTPGTKGKY